MHVRPVRREDTAALAGLLARIDDTYFQPHPMTAEGAIAVARRVGRDVYLIGWVAQRPIAYGMLRGWDEGFEVPSLGVAVRDDHGRHGHGRSMMLALHETARARGAGAVRLRVAPANHKARRLYDSLGYTDVGAERGERLMLLGL